MTNNLARKRLGGTSGQRERRRDDKSSHKRDVRGHGEEMGGTYGREVKRHEAKCRII